MPPIRTPDLTALGRQLGDIGNKLDSLFSKEGPGKKWADSFVEARDKARDLELELVTISNEFAKAQTQADKISLGIRFEHVERSLRKARKEANLFNQTLKVGIGVFDKLGKSIIGLGLGSFTIGLQQLSKQVYKVWDLFERWTKLMGQFNMRIGAASGNMKSAVKFGLAWEGAIRGITDQMGLGMQMAADFIETFDRMPLDAKTKEGARFTKMMLGLARGFNLGGEGAGQFADMMQRLAVSEVMSNEPKKAAEQYKEMNDASADAFKDIVAGAKAANVPVNKFFKDIVKAKDFFAEVGKEGAKGLTTAIAFVKRLGVSVQSLKKFTDFTDTFDQTAVAVAKLNTVFGTSINSMEVMLEQDPGKRFEIVRQSLLAQGKTFDNLSRIERKIIAENMQLSVEEVNAMLKRGLTLEQLEEEQAKAREKKLKSEEMIRRAMAKTAETMFAFKLAWDNVTKAVIKLIKPFTDVLGLTSSGEKGAKSFSQVMDGLFKRLIKFIEEVAGNKDWQRFMKRLANDAVDLAKKISAIATGPGLGDWINKIVKAGNDFYDIMKEAFGVMVTVGKAAMPILSFIGKHLKEILALWAGVKVAQMGAGALMMGSTMGAAGGLTGKAAMGIGKVGGALGGIAGGAAAGYATGGGTMGGMIGGGIGGLLGIINPFLGVVGGAVGGWLGKHAERLMFPNRLRDAQEYRQKVEKEIADITRQRIEQEQKYIQQLDSLMRKQAMANREQAKADDLVKNLGSIAKRKGRVEVGLAGQATLAKRLGEAEGIGVSSPELVAIKKQLQEASGPISLTKKQMEQISIASGFYSEALTSHGKRVKENGEKELNELRETQLKKKDEDLQGVQQTKETLEKNKKLLSDLEKTPPQEIVKKAFETFAAGTVKKNITSDEAKKLLKNYYEATTKFAEKELADREKKLAKLQINNEKELQDLKLRNQILSSKEFFDFAQKLRANNPNIDDETINRQFVQGLKGGFGSLTRSQVGRLLGVKPTAQGGIAMGPQYRLVGEAGPEAILPLKALVTGGDSLSSSSIGAKAAEGIVNLAKGRTGGGAGTAQQITIEVPLHLDSFVVARAVSRALLTDVEAI